MRVHHYMVEFNDKNDRVQFANDRDLATLAEATTLARKTSKKHDEAYEVAFVPAMQPGTYTAVGHVAFYNGHRGATEGRV